MAIKVKDIGTLATKWSTRAQAAATDYKNGVQDPRRSQSESAIAAAPTWQQAVQDPMTLSRFTAGLRRAGDAGWQAGVMTKGSVRYGPGVAASVGKFNTNFAPFLQAISNVTLGPRGLRGAPQNIARVGQIADALHALKAQRAGTGA